MEVLILSYPVKGQHLIIFNRWNTFQKEIKVNSCFNLSFNVLKGYSELQETIKMLLNTISEPPGSSEENKEEEEEEIREASVP